MKLPWQSSILLWSIIISFPISFAWAQQSIPRPEHPKPQFQRDHWVNLNGSWKFKMDAGISGKERGWHKDPSEFDQTINVPFPMESKLSGIEFKDFMPAVWYHRTFELPADWDEELVFLHFGAVDYDCEVWVNGIRGVDNTFAGQSEYRGIYLYPADGCGAGS